VNLENKFTPTRLTLSVLSECLLRSILVHKDILRTRSFLASSSTRARVCIRNPRTLTVPVLVHIFRNSTVRTRHIDIMVLRVFRVAPRTSSRREEIALAEDLYLENVIRFYCMCSRTVADCTRTYGLQRVLYDVKDTQSIIR
jgi:hypothetical protein